MSELWNDAQEADARRCVVEMLGPLRLQTADQAVTRFPTRKVAALLAYLALRPGPHPRVRLLDLFWPDLDPAARRNNLNTTLASIRRLVEPDGVLRGSVLISTHAELGFNPTAITTDVARFETLLERAFQNPEPAQRALLLQEAVGLYRDDLLPGHDHDWAVREQERLLARLREALERLCQDQEVLGDLPGALSSAERLCALDPYSEEAHCRQVGLYIHMRRIELASEAQERFVRRFAEEFGTSPLAATQEAVAALLAQSPTIPLPASVQTGACSRNQLPSVVKPGATSPDVSSPLPVLPVLLTRFFGRESELEYLRTLLLPPKAPPVGAEGPEAPVRLVSLVGPGGIGKTRLAVEFARHAAIQFAARCAFISLADLTEANQIPGALFQALRLKADPAAPALQHVIEELRNQDRPGASLVLILDNLEHLLPADEYNADGMLGVIIQSLLESVRGLRVLCTSRHRLGIRGERLVIVSPLQVPQVQTERAVPPDIETLLTIPSIRLYVDRAQAIRPDFSLTPTNAPAVAALCRQLEGSPLALELAAAWVRTLPPRKMWDRLTRGLDIPPGSYADLPARHRTLTAVLDWSYRLLSERQQRLLARLSVFSGGWTAEAASEICEESEAWAILVHLREASLAIVTDETEGAPRYRFLETVHAFSRQRLIDMMQHEEIQTRHAAYFFALTRDAAAGIEGDDASIWLARLEAEHENLRAALKHYQEMPDGAANGLTMANALLRYWEFRGHQAEGFEFVCAGLERLEVQAPTKLRARSLSIASILALHLADFELSQALQREALAIWEQLGDPRGMAGALHNLATVLVPRGRYAEARDLYVQALAINRELGNKNWEALNLSGLGDTLSKLGDSDEAIDHFQKALELARQIGDRYSENAALGNLAMTYLQRGDYAAAHHHASEALELLQATGNRSLEPYNQFCLGETARRTGDLLTAEEWFRQALVNAWQQRLQSPVPMVLEGIAAVRMAQGSPARAVQIYSVASALLLRLQLPREAHDQADYEHNLAAARAQLSDEEFAAAWAEGNKMLLEEGIQRALQEL